MAKCEERAAINVLGKEDLQCRKNGMRLEQCALPTKVVVEKDDYITTPEWLTHSGERVYFIEEGGEE